MTTTIEIVAGDADSGRRRAPAAGDDRRDRRALQRSRRLDPSRSAPRPTEMSAPERRVPAGARRRERTIGCGGLKRLDDDDVRDQAHVPRAARGAAAASRRGCSRELEDRARELGYSASAGSTPATASPPPGACTRAPATGTSTTTTKPARAATGSRGSCDRVDRAAPRHRLPTPRRWSGWLSSTPLVSRPAACWSPNRAAALVRRHLDGHRRDDRRSLLPDGTPGGCAAPGGLRADGARDREEGAWTRPPSPCRRPDDPARAGGERLRGGRRSARERLSLRVRGRSGVRGRRRRRPWTTSAAGTDGPARARACG